MTNLKRKLLAVAMVTVVSAGGVFAQKGKGEDKRPPKGDTRVVVSPKGERPPPKNDNQDKPKKDKKGRP